MGFSQWGNLDPVATANRLRLPVIGARSSRSAISGPPASTSEAISRRADMKISPLADLISGFPPGISKTDPRPPPPSHTISILCVRSHLLSS